jgi:hypothetical protein
MAEIDWQERALKAEKTLEGVKTAVEAIKDRFKKDADKLHDCGSDSAYYEAQAVYKEFDKLHDWLLML